MSCSYCLQRLILSQLLRERKAPRGLKPPYGAKSAGGRSDTSTPGVKQQQPTAEL
jgi:hypothetical protein